MKYIYLLAILFCLCTCKEKEIVTPSAVFYPNPFKDVTTLSLTANTSWEVSFYNKDGAKIKDASGGAGYNTVSFDFSSNKKEVILAEVRVDSDYSYFQLLNAAE